MAVVNIDEIMQQVKHYERQVANKLVLARLSCNMDLSDVADQTGISESVMLRYECAVEDIPASDLFKIASVVGVSVEYFFDDEESIADSTLEAGLAKSLLH